MNIIYIASIYSEKYTTIFKNKMVYSAFQKFHNLIIEGLVLNQQNITIYTSAKIGGIINPYKKDQNDNKRYFYLFYINIPIIKHLCVFIATFFKVLFKKKDVIIICDILNISLCIGSILASKIRGFKTIAIVTDLPGFMIKSNQNIIDNLITSINMSYLNKLDYYVLLTEQMNDIINIKQKPYIVMEGLVDVCETKIQTTVNKNNNHLKIILYAGGLYEKYGIKILIDAFVLLKDKNVRLHLYGKGDMISTILEYSKFDNRITYKGVVSNNEIIDAEKKATLLVNPRPTSEDFTKYSFPSKNMEYMVSGTPLLTTKLPGMPNEYYDFVFLFEDETVMGYYKSLSKIISLDFRILSMIGDKAKKYVINNKNNIIQTNRLLDLYKNKRPQDII